MERKELIKITTKGEKQTVSARELYERLGYDLKNGNFSHWIKRKINYLKCKYEKVWYKKDDPFKNVVEFNGSIFKMSANGYVLDYNIQIEEAIAICRLCKRNPISIKIIEQLQKSLGFVVEVKESKPLEFQFGEMLEKIIGFDWLKQYTIPNERGWYRLDFYLENTLIVEYDEQHHHSQNEADNERINYCREWLATHNENGDVVRDDGWRCPVIRVRKGEELEGLNRIIRHLVSFGCFDK